MKRKDKPDLTPLESLGHAAECLRTLAHPHRLRMIQMVLRDEHTVGELALACDIPSNMASEHLRLMEARGLVAGERRGRRAYYKVREPYLASIMACIENRFGIEAKQQTHSHGEEPMPPLEPPLQ